MYLFLLFLSFLFRACVGRLGEKGEKTERALQSGASASCQQSTVFPSSFALFPTYFSFPSSSVVAWNLVSPVTVSDYVVTSNFPSDGTSYTGSWEVFGANAGAFGVVLDSQPPTTFTANSGYDYLITAPASYAYYQITFVPAVDPAVFGTSFTVTLCDAAPPAGAVAVLSLAAGEDLALEDLAALYYVGDYNPLLADPDLLDPAGIAGPEGLDELLYLGGPEGSDELSYLGGLGGGLDVDADSAGFWLGGVEVLDYAEAAAEAEAEEAATADGVDVVCAAVAPDLIAQIAYSLAAPPFPNVSAVSWRLTAPVTVGSYVVSANQQTRAVVIQTYTGAWTLYGAAVVPPPGTEWPPDAAYTALDAQTGTLEAGDVETFPLAAAAVAPYLFYGLVFSPPVDPSYFATFNVELCKLNA